MEPNEVDSISLQKRDLAFFRALFESRVMTIEHIAILHFSGSKEAAKKRLQKLKSAGFIAERPRRASEAAVHFLARKGLSILREQGILADYPITSLPNLDKRSRVSDLTIRHELEVMDVKAAFHAALARFDRLSLLEFSTWPLLHEFRVTHPHSSKAMPVRPDGFIRIHEKEGATKGYVYECFLEVDRSSEVLDTLVAKAVAYLEYYKSGGFAERNAAPRSEFKSFPFRVLMILKSAERRNNIAERLVQNTPSILTHTWLTTFAEVTADPLGAIWIQPKGYRDATAGTKFATDRKTPAFVYRRESAREDLIESTIKKLRLLEG